jgi:hypothetical protein
MLLGVEIIKACYKQFEIMYKKSETRFKLVYGCTRN